jgi:hypothetical protein
MKKPKPRVRTGRRTGRPIKDVPAGRTVQLGILVAAETKAIIAKAAEASGKSLSREAEALIERALTYDRQFQAMGTSLEQIKQGNLTVELLKAGYVPLRDPAGNVTWLPPGHPANPGRSGFEEIKPGELEEHLARVAAAHEQAGVTDEEIQRRNQEKFEAADKRPTIDINAAIDRIDEIEEIANAPKKDSAA